MQHVILNVARDFLSSKSCHFHSEGDNYYVETISVDGNAIK